MRNPQTYRKIPKISPGYIFQRPFLRGLLLEGLIFGGAYVRREICVSKSIGLACSGKEIYHFCFVLLFIRGQIPSTRPPGSLYSEGRFNGEFYGNYKSHETTRPAHQRSLWIFLSQNGALAIPTILLRCLRVILVILKPCDRFGPSDLLCLVNHRRKRVGDPLLQDAILGKKLIEPRRCHGRCKKVPRTMNLHLFKLYRVICNRSIFQMKVEWSSE